MKTAKKTVFVIALAAMSIPFKSTAQSINLSASDAITATHSTSGSGYGSKIYPKDDGNGLTTLRFATRGNSATWTDAMLIRAADANGGGNGNVSIGEMNLGSSLINEMTKRSKLSVYQPTALGGTKGNYTTIVTFGGVTENVFMNSLWLLRDATGSSWSTARLHDGIAIDNSFLVPGSTTKTWWERSPNNNIQAWGNEGTAYMTLKAGNLGIGIVPSGSYRLEVNGTIRTKKVIVEPTEWADFVFAPDYKLRTLSEVETHIEAHGHLPEIPSAAEVAEKGVDLTEINQKLLQKVEELTLYVIQLNKDVELLRNNK